MKQYLLERDALNGKEGKGFATINGEVIELFRFRNFSLTSQFDEADFKVVGTRRKQKKTTGIQLNWNATVYMGDKCWEDIINKYLKTGQCTYFTLQITNDDPNATIGEHTILIKECKLTSCDVIKLDADADWLDQSISGTALDFDTLAQFNQPEVIGGNE